MSESVNEPSAEVLSRRERLACAPRDPCACDNTCRNHRVLAELEDLLTGKDLLIRLHAAALDVWKKGHPHEEHPGACARALAEKDARLSQTTEDLLRVIGKQSDELRNARDVRFWARQAREAIEQSVNETSVWLVNGAAAAIHQEFRALLNRAPEGME